MISKALQGKEEGVASGCGHESRISPDSGVPLSSISRCWNKPSKVQSLFGYRFEDQCLFCFPTLSDAGTQELQHLSVSPWLMGQ